MKMKPCIPDSLPLEQIDFSSLKPLLEKAHHVVQSFDQILKETHHTRDLFHLLTIQEAIDSIEGGKKRVNIVELLTKKEGPVFHCLNGIVTASRSKSSISTKLILKIHQCVKRGDPKREVGRLRDRQNWIGVEGCRIEKSHFLPPAPEQVVPAMKNLQHYLNDRKDDPLLQLAIYFAQLLVIHPFMDGNGRVARTLLPLFLWKRKLIREPLFYLSGYFKRHQSAYYRKLNQISAKREWTPWVAFFLEGVIEEGKRNCLRAEKLIELYEKWARKVSNHFSPIQTQKIVRFLFKTVVFSPQQLSRAVNISKIEQLKLYKLLHIQEKKGVMICSPLLAATAATH